MMLGNFTHLFRIGLAARLIWIMYNGHGIVYNEGTKYLKPRLHYAVYNFVMVIRRLFQFSSQIIIS